MGIALEQARFALERGDFPVGAVITIGGKIISANCNGNNTVDKYTEHAEARALDNFSGAIKRSKKGGMEAALFTTLEPCLMCLGTAVMTRIKRIVYACPDPNGGATSMKKEELGEWYTKKWPIIEQGLLRDEAYEIVLEGMKRDSPRWDRIRKMFEDMASKWD